MGAITGDQSVPIRVVKGAAASTDTDNTYLTNIKEVFARDTLTCALSYAGNLYCWGYEGSGELGNGPTTGIQDAPVRVVKGAADPSDTDGINLTNIKEIQGGDSHTCAVSNGYNLYCWGSDFYGQLGNGATTGNQDAPVRVLKGAAVPTDTDNTYLTNIKEVSVGTHHTCALSNEDNLYCWGLDDRGQLGNGVTTGNQDTPVRVVKGAAASTDTDSTYLTNIKEVSAGGFYTCAVSNTHNLYCWGSEIYGELGNGGVTGNQNAPVRVVKGDAEFSDTDGTNLTNIKEVSAQKNHTCAISNTENLYCWGDDSDGQLGNGAITGTQDAPIRVHDGEAVSTIVHDQVKYGIDWDMQGGGLLNQVPLPGGLHNPGGPAINVWGDGGGLLYLANDDGRVVSYSTDGSGNLTYVSTNGDAPGFVIGIWGDGRFVYSASKNGGLNSYSADAYGNLTFIDTTDGEVDEGTFAMEVWGDGRFVYIADGGGGIKSYAVDDYGNLTLKDSDSTSTRADDVWGDGNFVYLADGDGYIHTYKVDDSGVFTLMSSYILNNPGDEYMNSVWGDGTYLYGSGDNGLQSFSVDSITGVLTLKDSDDPAGGLGDSVWGDGRFVYLGNDGGGIYSYSVDSNGMLTRLDFDAPGGNAYGIWADGDYVYLANDTLGLRSYAVSDGVDTWTSFGPANIAQIASHIWSVGGSQTFRVTVEDDSGGYSPWAYHTINLGFPDISGTRGNVTGLAWSSKLGEYVSFDCADTVGGDSCATLPYGVNIQGTPIAGDFEGHAWNDTVGWIGFSAADVASCGAVGNLATNNTVTGNARVLYGAPGSCMDLGGTPPNDPVTYDPVSGEFQGWAWGGDLLGWVSFNSLTCDADEDGLSDGQGAAMSIAKTKIITDNASPEAGDPEVDQTVTYLDSPNDLYIKDGYAYVVSDNDSTFSIFDITTNPAQPSLVGTLRDGEISGGGGGTLRYSFASTNGQLNIDDSSQITGDVYSKTNMVIDYDSTINGSVYGEQDVRTYDGIAITGDVVVKGDADILYLSDIGGMCMLEGGFR
jgi:hypothetical protein